MSNNLITEIGNAQKRTDVPAFRAGDTIKVHVKVVEGSRSRVQIFQGVVIRIHGAGIGRKGQRRGVGGPGGWRGAHSGPL